MHDSLAIFLGNFVSSASFIDVNASNLIWPHSGCDSGRGLIRFVDFVCRTSAMTFILLSKKSANLLANSEGGAHDW